MRGKFYFLQFNIVFGQTQFWFPVCSHITWKIDADALYIKISDNNQVSVKAKYQIDDNVHGTFLLASDIHYCNWRKKTGRRRSRNTAVTNVNFWDDVFHILYDNRKYSFWINCCVESWSWAPFYGHWLSFEVPNKVTVFKMIDTHFVMLGLGM